MEPKKPSEDANKPPGHQKISGKAWGVLQFRKLRTFPFSVFFIVGNEFCERFSYYGMRAVLVLFLHNQLNFNENTSTALYHGFIVLCYLLPLFGAFISDSCLGKYKTILILSIVYAIGNIIMSISAIPFVMKLNISLAILGLVIIALGTGGIKPCVAAFGGDQFKETQEDMLRRFFSLFYFSINAGSVISTLLTPILRNYVNCFETCECFALAFGIPAILMIISIVVFVSGTPVYIIKQTQKKSSMLYFDVPRSIMKAIYQRFVVGKVPGKQLLHYACPKYSADFMNDVGMLLRVVVMLLPLPIFWALFDQQGSRWTLQANRMNGQLGKFAIQPDQMQALNPILILLFIPIFETIIYPLFGMCHLLKRPLQRMVIGMVLAGLSFVVAGFIELKVQSSQQKLNSGESKLFLFNGAETPFSYKLMQYNGLEIANDSLNVGESTVLPIESGNFNLTLVSQMGGNHMYSFEANEFNVSQLFVSSINETNLVVLQREFTENLPSGGNSSIMIFNLITNQDFSIIIEREGGADINECNTGYLNISLLKYGEASEPENITIGRYEYKIIFQQEIFNESFNENFKSGAIYAVIFYDTDGAVHYNITIDEIDPPNSVSMFLQVPMYVLITAGEVMFSITGLEFAYSQAPSSMKAMCQAAWLLTVAGGNFIVLIIAESSAFSNQAVEFFFFAILIGAVALLFAIMSFFFKYVDHKSKIEENSSDRDETSSLLPSESKTEAIDNGELDLSKEKSELDLNKEKSENQSESGL